MRFLLIVLAVLGVGHTLLSSSTSVAGMTLEDESRLGFPYGFVPHPFTSGEAEDAAASYMALLELEQQVDAELRAKG